MGKRGILECRGKDTQTLDFLNEQKNNLYGLKDNFLLRIRPNQAKNTFITKSRQKQSFSSLRVLRATPTARRSTATNPFCPDSSTLQRLHRRLPPGLRPSAAPVHDQRYRSASCPDMAADARGTPTGGSRASARQARPGQSDLCTWATREVPTSSARLSSDRV